MLINAKYNIGDVVVCEGQLCRILNRDFEKYFGYSYYVRCGRVFTWVREEFFEDK